MYPYMNEDVAWQRLLDMQREIENDRQWAQTAPHVLKLAGRLAVRVWILAGLATRRAPRYRPVPASESTAELASTRHAA